MINILCYLLFFAYAIISLITIGGWCYATIRDIKENGMFGDKKGIAS